MMDRPQLRHGELARAVLPSGDLLTLRKRGQDFEIRFNLLELMSSRNADSERALGRLACARLDGRAPDILIGGLGMGYTLRSVLDQVGQEARVTIAELLPEVIEWNRGPLADLAGRPLDDPRVTVHAGDVADILSAQLRTFDAVLMDVDNGPEAVLFPSNHGLYSALGVELVLASLKPRGVFGLWSADRSTNFERLLEAGGFPFECVTVALDDGKRLAHAIYLVRPA